MDNQTHKHTPGPWTSFEDGEAHPGVEAFDSNISIVIISYPAVEDDGGVRGQSHAEAVANARLIAAAPDLLEALEVYLMAGHKEARRQASVKAKAAIAKAKEGAQ